jgi:hypothetical protein
VRTERRFEIGPLVGAAGALLLLVSLFLDWYGPFTAFTVFEVLDLVLAALAVASLVSLADRLGARLPGGLAFGGTAALPLGVLALVIVVSQLINHPPVAVDLDPQIGLWLALAGAVLLVAGSLLALARISLAVDVERRMRRGEDAAVAEQREPPA